MVNALIFVFLSAAPATTEPPPAPEQSAILGIEKSGETWVRPRPPAEGRADLLLILERPRPAEMIAGEEIEVALEDAREKRRPDLLVPAPERFYAAWYDLPAGPHRLTAGARRLYLADRMIELRSGEVRELTLNLARRPDVRIQIELPESERRSQPLGLELEALRPPRRLGAWKLEGDAEEALLEQLPPVDAEFVLRAPRWTFRSPLDLSRGRDGQLRFDPGETNLHGYLTVGGRPATGIIHFQLPDQKGIAVKTDGRGWYDAFLFRRGLYQIAVEIGKNEHYRFYYDLPEVARKVLDIDVPTARYQVRAIDRETREHLMLKRARYEFRDEEDRRLEGELKIIAGKAILPPFGVGRLDLFLVAEGYVEREWKDFELSPEGPGSTLVAKLDLITEWVELRLLQESGEPVAGAHLRILRDGFSDQVLWQGRSGPLGLVRVPGQYQGMPVLVRAEGFAFHADFLPPPTPSEEQWQLERAAKQKTRLVVVDAESRTLAGAEVAVRIGKVWLRGEALAWLAGSASASPLTDGGGTMMLRDLPPSRKLLVLARAGSFDLEEVEALAYHAKTIESPAPPFLVVPASIE